MRIRLATRFSATIAGILTLSLVSSLVALYAAWCVDRRLEQAHQEDLPSVRAEEIQILLLDSQFARRVRNYWTRTIPSGQRVWTNRKGIFNNGSPRFAVRLLFRQMRKIFLQRLQKKWADLDAAQQKTIELHRNGNAEKAKTLLLTEIREHLSKDAYDLCEQLIASNDRDVKQIMERADTRIRVTTWVAAITVGLTLALGGVLVWMFVYRVLVPLRGMGGLHDACSAATRAVPRMRMNCVRWEATSEN